MGWVVVWEEAWNIVVGREESVKKVGWMVRKVND